MRCGSKSGRRAGALLLTNDIFAQLVGGVQVTGGYIREKREVGRAPFSSRAAIVRLGASAMPEFVRIRDISPKGVGFLHRSTMTAGEAFALALRTRKGKRVLLKCSAVRCQPVDPGLWVVGAVFESVLGSGKRPMPATGSQATGGAGPG